MEHSRSTNPQNIQQKNLYDKNCSLTEDVRVLEAVIENSTDAIQVSDKNMVTILINRAYEVLTGINRDELIGVPVSELVEKGLISASCGALVAATKRPQTIVQTFPRTGRQAHVSCNPVFDKNGEIEFFICNDRDPNEIQELQNKFHEATLLNDRYLQELEAFKTLHREQGNLVVEDTAMRKVLALASHVAKVDSTVLLLGETGVGKDEIARFIHFNSSRSNQQFVAVNCSAIVESLFESELFGHEGHAFTGAGSRSKPGLFEVANHGTIFLDEVGELSMNMQTKLLRVLQNQSFIRVGGSTPIQLDVRILAATNCNLEQKIAEKQFREDLYYRLSVVPIHIPPLRERQNDIIPLAQHFLQHYNEKYHFQKKLSSTACFALLNYNWVGNVRQLRNAIEQAVVLATGDLILPEHLPMNIAGPVIIPENSSELISMDEVLEQTELKYLNLWYEKYGNVRDAARHLQMSPATFVRHRNCLLKKCGGESI